MKTNLLKLSISLLILFIFYGCDYKPKNQEYIDISKDPESRNISHKRYQLKDTVANRFNVKENTIYVKIPVTEEKLNIKKVVDVSSDSLNAIVIVLDGNDGEETEDLPIIGFKVCKLKINKIKGLDKELLKKHGKLKVFVFHDDKFDKDKLKKEFENCIKKSTKYDESKCTLSRSMIDQNPGLAPREQEGDIIPGE